MYCFRFPIALSVSESGIKKRRAEGWESGLGFSKTNWRAFLQTETNAKVKQCKHTASRMWTVVITELRGTARSWVSKELWPSSAPLINSYSDRKPEPALHSAFKSHPICLQKPNFSLFIPDWWSSILCQWRDEGSGGWRGWGIFFFLSREGLKCIPVCWWNINPRYVSLVKPLGGLSQHDIIKAALYCHTSRRNNNEPWGLWGQGESGCKCFMIWQRCGQSK